MADISLLVPKIIEWEKWVFTDNPEDLGGATFCGITFTTFSAWYSKHNNGKIPTIQDLKNLNIEEFTSILKEDFWDKVRGDNILSQEVANIIVDWFFNSGYAAIGEVQKLLGIHPTDYFGPLTLAAVNRSNPQELTNQIVAARISFCKEIVKNHPSQEEFLEGWIRRAESYKVV